MNHLLQNRQVIRLAPLAPGEDVRGFLQGLVTNDVAGEGLVYAALLAPQGKVLFDFFVTQGPETGAWLIDCEGAHAEELVTLLSRYRLRRRIGIAVDTQCVVWWSPEEQAGQDAGQDAGGPDPRLPALGQRGLVPLGDDNAHWPDGSAAFRAHRLALGVTEGRAELGFGDTLWLECNAAELNGVSFSKGCYVGQENTARMNWRQKVNRRLVVVPLVRSDPGRQRVAYPELGLAVDHRRVEDLPAELWPAWLGPRDGG